MSQQNAGPYRSGIITALHNNQGNRLTAELINGLFVLIDNAMSQAVTEAVKAATSKPAENDTIAAG